MTQSATDPGVNERVHIEEFDRFDLLIFEEGRQHAVVRQWPTMMEEVWHIDAPRTFSGLRPLLSKIAEEGWEPLNVSTHTRGMLWWKTEIRTWLFRKRILCRKESSLDGPGSTTSRLTPAQEIDRVLFHPHNGYNP